MVPFLKKGHLVLVAFIAISWCGKGQSIPLPFTQSDQHWEFHLFSQADGRYHLSGTYPEIEGYMGKESVFLKRATFLSTKKADFKDGTIEVDINFPEVRNFPGIGFRFQNADHFEMFYIGPTKSGKFDATRYTPVFNGQQSWQVYAGEGYSRAFTFKYNHWHHVKIELEGLKASFFIDDMQTPLFTVIELKHGWKAGKVVLIADENDLHFANFKYTPKTYTPPLLQAPLLPSNGKITEWWVSGSVDPRWFEKQYELTDTLKNKFKWEKINIDTSGILNFYQFSPISINKNAFIARVNIYAEKDQLKPLTFGFSDMVTIYLNNKAIYAGADVYGSRDDQFIGTMGFYDKIFLPLHKGKNELWFFVTEYFGGWAIQAKFESLAGISVR